MCEHTAADSDLNRLRGGSDGGNVLLPTPAQRCSVGFQGSSASKVGPFVFSLWEVEWILAWFTSHLIKPVGPQSQVGSAEGNCCVIWPSIVHRAE